jgi:hypothetical protein
MIIKIPQWQKAFQPWDKWLQFEPHPPEFLQHYKVV